MFVVIVNTNSNINIFVILIILIMIVILKLVLLFLHLWQALREWLPRFVKYIISRQNLWIIIFHSVLDTYVVWFDVIWRCVKKYFQKHLINITVWIFILWVLVFFNVSESKSLLFWYKFTTLVFNIILVCIHDVSFQYY